MSKTYYIFLALVSFFCLLLGFLLTRIFYCPSDTEEVLSLGSFGEKEEEEVRKENGCDFFVDVSGAVVEPGVVCLAQGSILNDAIEKAQGFNPSAYAFKYVAQRINLARILENEEKVYIPFRDDVVCTRVQDEQVDYIASVVKEIRMPKSVVGEPFSEAKVVGSDNDEEEKVINEDCISINSASKEELMKLVGVGEARAGDIIAGRPYSKLEDIKTVPGIGDRTFENIENFICL